MGTVLQSRLDSLAAAWGVAVQYSQQPGLHSLAAAREKGTPSKGHCGKHPGWFVSRADMAAGRSAPRQSGQHYVDCARLALVPGVRQAGQCPLCTMLQHGRTA